MKGIRNKIKSVVDVLMMSPWWQRSSTDCMVRFIVSTVFSVASAILGIVDFMNGSVLMMITSIVLVVGFAASAVAARKFQNADASSHIIAGLVCFVLSVYVITGGNGGFAILWVLLVPILAVNVLGISMGFATATYFLLFIFMMFYTPMNEYIADKYTSFFIARFPVLYLSDYILSLYLSLQKEYFSRKVHLLAYKDGLTDCYNRRFFSEQLDKYTAEPPKDFSVVVIDLNGLKATNDNLGHKAGDELICALPRCYSRVFEKVKNCDLCRTGGDEYIILAEQPSDVIAPLLEKMTSEAENWSGQYSKGLHFAYGCASVDSDPGLSFEELHKKADTLMYENKSAYYRKSGLDRRKN